MHLLAENAGATVSRSGTGGLSGTVVVSSYRAPYGPIKMSVPRALGNT